MSNGKVYRCPNGVELRYYAGDGRYTGFIDVFGLNGVIEREVYIVKPDYSEEVEYRRDDVTFDMTIYGVGATANILKLDVLTDRCVVRELVLRLPVVVRLSHESVARIGSVPEILRGYFPLWLANIKSTKDYKYVTRFTKILIDDDTDIEIGRDTYECVVKVVMERMRLVTLFVRRVGVDVGWVEVPPL